MGDKHSVSAETESSSPPISLSDVNVRRSVSPPTNLSLEACGIYDEQVNGNVSPSQVRNLVSSVSPKAQRTMSPTQEQAKLSPASIRDDAKLSPTSSTHSVPCQGGSGPIGVSRKYPHGGGRCMAGACLARAGLNADSCQHVGDTVVSMNGDAQKDNMSRSNNSDSPKSPVSSPKALSPVVQVRNGGLTPSAESHVNTSDADTKTDTSPATDATAQIGVCKATSPSDPANLTGRGCLGVTATPFPALPPPYRVTRTSPIAPHKGQSSQSSSATQQCHPAVPSSSATQQDSNLKKSASGGGLTNGLPTCQLPVTGASFASTVQCQPASPGSSVAGSVASFSFDGAAPGGRQKQTLGELLQQIDVVSRALRSKGDFTCPDFLPDLQFLAHQSRYNSDVGVRRRIISRLVDAGILEISIKVFWFLSSADYLGTVATATTMAADHNDNMDESTESIPMLLARGRQDHRRPLMASQGKMNSVDSECQSQVSMTDTVKIIHAVITCLQYTTERSAILCEGCVRRGLMQMMLLELADPRLACTDPKDQCKVYVVKGFLSILGNIIRNYGDGRFAFRLAGALRVLQLHLKSPLLPVKIKTIILLSYVVTETENEIVNATDKNIGLVVKMLQTTVDSNNHFSRKYGFSASEAVAGLNRLAGYELNKERVVKCGALPLYTRLLQKESSHEEQLLAVRGVWALAFHQGNRRLLQQDEACLQALQHLEKEGTREELRSSARGALWVICGRNMLMRDVVPVSSVSAGDYHVMVSYQWSARVYVARLCDRLQAAGCKVWLDLEHKGGAPVEVMKEAVEKASIVLVCLSQKYKDSPSCRTEAEYVEASRRPLIPLCVQPHFTPDGWLTALVADKFVYNFSHETYVSLQLDNLLKDISCCGGARAKKARPHTDTHSAPVTRDTPPAPQHVTAEVRLRSKVSRWTTKEVIDWLTSNDLDPVTGSFKHVNGELLEQVRRLQVAAPETFYAVLKRDLGLEFIDILKFTAALEKLPWSSSIS